ncbi:MAG TPA: GNAT family N-acetyltransferase [Vicinamibacterales bacterium]|nr:GNAT family N-acetyltransferase [Vicinamibacterales bacterium]
MTAPWQDEVPRLSGSIVELREVRASDAPVLFELLSDEAVQEHLSSPPPSVDAFEGFVRWAIDQRGQGNCITFGIVPHGLADAVGIVQLRALDPTWFVAEWGFALGLAFWGTGVFAEAAELVVRFAFEALRVDRLEARAATLNGRANGALNKMGASAEVTLMRSFKRLNGRYDEQLLWSLRAEDWRQGGLFTPARFDAQRAKQRIADATADVRRHLQERRASRGDAASSSRYPFLLTRPRKKSDPAQ